MHRVIALVVACAIACAPSLVGACEIACANAQATAGAMHACHHHATTPDETRGLASIHGCAHLDGLPGTAAEKLVPPAHISITAGDGLDASAGRPSRALPAWAAPPPRPPDLSLRTIQLRI